MTVRRHIETLEEVLREYSTRKEMRLNYQTKDNSVSGWLGIENPFFSHIVDYPQKEMDNLKELIEIAEKQWGDVFITSHGSMIWAN